MTEDCEFLLRLHSKLQYPGFDAGEANVIVVRCSLTGRVCFAEGVSPKLCTRRTFALDYVQKLDKRKQEEAAKAATPSPDSPG